MFDKIKKTVKTLIDNLSPIEYGAASLTAMLTVPITMMLMKILLA